MRKKLSDDKKAFLVYADYEQHIEKLTREQRGDLLTAMFAYYNQGIILQGLDAAVDMLMSVISAQMRRDNEKYMELCEKNRQNGMKAVANKVGKNEKVAESVTTNEISDENVPVGDLGTLNAPNGTLKDKDNNNDKDNENDNVNINIKDNDTYIVTHKDCASFAEPILLPLKGGGFYTVTEEETAQYIKEFPLVPVGNELVVLKLWLEEKPSRLRSIFETKRLIHSWLSKRAERNGKIAELSVKKGIVSTVTNLTQDSLRKNLEAYMSEHPEELRWLEDE